VALVQVHAPRFAFAERPGQALIEAEIEGKVEEVEEG
jgi:hypothetical protein